MKTANIIIAFAALFLCSSLYSQATISLIGFKGIGVSTDIVHSIAQRIESKLPEACNCPVVSQEELDGSMIEFLNSRAGQESVRVSANQNSKVEKILTGTISKVGPSYSMVLKIIGVNSGIIERSISREHSGSIEALFQFTDNTVTSLFTDIKPMPAVDTVYIPQNTTLDSPVHTPVPEKEVISNRKNELSGTGNSDQNATNMMEKIGIGAIAIFACLAAIILTNTAK